jgi:Family of unknown function (DUF5333)
MTSAVIFGHKPLIPAVCHGISTVTRHISAARAAKEANMKRPFKHLTLTIALAFAAPAVAQVPINEEPVIIEKLLQGFIGDAIADNCPTMEPRNLRALGELNALRDHALEQGYTSAEVRAFVGSDEEKAKFRARAAEWLKEKGAEPGNPDAYCKIGEEEIAKESLIGYLLRSKK